jgi:hypothetical protein
MTDAEIEGLLDQLTAYRRAREAGAGSYKLAVAENKIWEVVSNHHGKGFTKVIGEKRDWFHRRFGGNTSDYDFRSNMLKADKWAHHLFEMVDAGELSLNQAATAVREARKISQIRQVDLDLALKAAVANTLETTRRKKPGKQEEPKERARKSSKAPALNVEEMELSKNKIASSKEFGRYMHQLGQKFIEAQFDEIYIDDYHKKRLAADFKVSLDQLLDEFRNTVTNTKNKTIDEGIEEIGEDSFNWACQVLGLRVEFGRPIDIKKVSKIQIRRARDLHPDRNPSKEAAAEYRAVNDAFTILKAYAQRQNRKVR